MKIAIIGHFAKWDKNIVDGQTTKTRNLYYLLSEEMEVSAIDTFEWKKNPLSLVKKINKHFKAGFSFIILPASNGVKIFPKLLLFFKKIYKKIKIYYSVIGGWLPSLLQQNKKLLKTISKLDGVWVETQTMYNQLIDLSLTNIHLVNNYKDIKPLKQNELNLSIPTPPYNFAIFSRINKIKGVSDAIQVIEKISKNNPITLDIYGPINDDYSDEFHNLLANNKNISYKGCIDSSKSIEILKDYFMLIFPTRYTGEGTPGTIIDAMSAGLPVISSKWPSYLGVVNEKNAILYNFLDICGLENAILYAINNPEAIISMKENCLKEAQKYTKEEILKQIENALKN